LTKALATATVEHRALVEKDRTSEASLRKLENDCTVLLAKLKEEKGVLLEATKKFEEEKGALLAAAKKLEAEKGYAPLSVSMASQAMGMWMHSLGGRLKKAILM
jgi:hypothetical protein